MSWLEDYFYLTEQGNWRPPLNEEERAEKTRLGSQAARRKLQRFCRWLATGEVIPPDLRPDTPTLAEWIRVCKRSGLFEQGKLLYEKGGLNLDNLPEEVMVNVEEDYQVCMRMLARAKDQPQKSRRVQGRRKGDLLLDMKGESFIMSLQPDRWLTPEELNALRASLKPTPPQRHRDHRDHREFILLYALSVSVVKKEIPIQLNQGGP